MQYNNNSEKYQKDVKQISYDLVQFHNEIRNYKGFENSGGNAYLNGMYKLKNKEI